MIQFQNSNVTVFQSLLYKTTSTVIQTEDCIIVVDPNLLPVEVEMIREYVDNVKGDRPLYLLFTHSDWDHLIGYGAFQEAIVIASGALSLKEDKEDILNQIFKFDHQYYLDRSYPILYPLVDIEVKEEGQVLEIGNTKLTFYHAQGHTDDGIFTVIEPLGIWLAGDYLSDIEFPFIYDNSEKYEETLRKTDELFNQHNIQYLIPGHGHITNIKEEIKFRKIAAQIYIKELRESIKENRTNSNLLQGYNYLLEFQTIHEENSTLIKKELSTSSVNLLEIVDDQGIEEVLDNAEEDREEVI
ncbi:MBL fold metallo-hydrolase [Lysinibacillus sp. BW-2-10]|uniref:MBL fold metallo-hydrolase n=1 Tax=Lysinibacillus sp. BW-2-10 TaxID=2590030 RepID=UPI00118174D8|nr:MBL fold metallo-hydrolase [Lysinibacillus sp. BW-2-10]TSI05209.1 MBL fold metallo-hydrolase [Lysinibacillus sp. BW-2-10]